MKDCTLSRSHLFEDILSYNLALIGCSEKSTGEEISTAAGMYLAGFIGSSFARFMLMTW